jgi:hypothetical protein
VQVPVVSAHITLAFTSVSSTAAARRDLPCRALEMVERFLANGGNEVVGKMLVSCSEWVWRARLDLVGGMACHATVASCHTNNIANSPKTAPHATCTPV